MTGVLLKPALEIAFATAPGSKAWGYKSTPDRLTFAWNIQASAVDSDFFPFVVPIDASRALYVVNDWLEDVAHFGPAPDTDGDAAHTFRLFCENWGFVSGNHYTFAAVEPQWEIYGK